MATNIRNFGPVREKITGNLMKTLRNMLSSQGIDVSNLPEDLAESGALESVLSSISEHRTALTARAKQAASKKEAEEILSMVTRIESVTDELSHFSKPAGRNKIFGETITVTGNKYVKFGQDPVDLRKELTELERDIRSHAKAVGVNLGDDVSGMIDLNKFAPSKAREFRIRRNKILGLPTLLGEQGVGSWVVNPEQARLNAGMTPYSVMIPDPTEEAGLRSVAFSRGSIQFRANVLDVPGLDDTDAFSLGGVFPTMETMDRDLERMKSGKLPGGRKAIIDIETAGLHTESGAWQLAVRYSDDPTKVENLYFRAPALDLGTMFKDGKSIPMSQALVGDEAYASLDDLKRVLTGINASDYVAGHNIQSFDIPFLAEDLHRIARNLSPEGVIDDDMLELIERFKGKTASGEVLDTLTLVGQKAAELNLSVAPEMLAMGKATPRSVENIMLQTNLLDLLSEKHGHEEVMKQLRRGVHYADVDTFFESAFLDDDIMSRLKGVDEANPFAIRGLEDNLDEVRSIISEAGALTPYMKMSDKDIAPGIKALMDQQGIGSITPFEHRVLEQRLRGRSVEAAEEVADVRSILRNAGTFRRHRDLLGEGVSQPDDFINFQSRMAELGIPFHDLSDDERALGAALGSMEGITTPFSDTAKLMDELLPSSTFFSEKSVQVFGNNIETTRIAIPEEVLRAAEEAGVFTHEVDGVKQVRTSIASGEEMYALSPFKYMSNGNLEKNVATTFRFSENAEEAAQEGYRLYNFLAANQREYKITKEMLDQLAPLLTGSAILENGDPWGVFKYGIQTGVARPPRALGDSGRSSVEAAYDILVRTMGGSPEGAAQPRDFSGPTFYVGRMGESFDSYGRTASRYGPAVLGTGIDNEFRAGYRKSTKASEQVFETVSGMGRGNVWREAAEHMKETGQEPFVLRAADFFSEHIGSNKKATLAGVAALTAGAGYYMYERQQKKNEYFTDTTAAMPMEEGDWYQDYQQEIGVASGFGEVGSRSYARPFDTMNVVSSLDRNKKGHHRMGPGKDAHLFGG